MAYCTEAQVRVRLPAFPDDVEHDAIITEGIAAAETDIDAALGSRYTVPFTDPVPAVIQQIAGDLAAAWTLETAFSGGGEEKPTKLATSLRKRGERRLKKLSEGTWRGVNTLVSRGTIRGQSARATIRTSTEGTTPLLRDWQHPGLA